MRKYFLLPFFFLACIEVSAQNGIDEDGRGLKKQNMFFGANLNLGFANRSFNIGVNPEFGYSLTRWLDAGIAANFNYFSQNATDFSSIRYRNVNYGGGIFTRIWPVNFLFLQVQPEYNWISSAQKNVITQQAFKYSYSAQSLLVGIGYGTRMIGSRYTYFTLMMDVLQNPNSPYRDQFNDPLPVIRAGFGIYFRSGRR
ncbi:MAG: hypothetical protein ACKOOA_00525 [Sediminibacterium sp.]